MAESPWQIGGLLWLSSSVKVFEVGWGSAGVWILLHKDAKRRVQPVYSGTSPHSEWSQFCSDVQLQRRWTYSPCHASLSVRNTAASLYLLSPHMRPFCHCHQSHNPSTSSVLPCFHPEKWLRNYNSETTPRQPSSDSSFTDWNIVFFIKKILYLQGSFFLPLREKSLMYWSSDQPISLKRLEVPCTAPLETLCRAIILCWESTSLLRIRILTSDAFTYFSNSQTLRSFPGLITHANVIYIWLAKRLSTVFK